VETALAREPARRAPRLAEAAVGEKDGNGDAVLERGQRHLVRADRIGAGAADKQGLCGGLGLPGLLLAVGERGRLAREHALRLAQIGPLELLELANLVHGEEREEAQEASDV